MTASGEEPGLSYVKSRDVPAFGKTADSERRLQERLDAMAPAERAAMEDRIRRSAQADDAAFLARVSTLAALDALGADPSSGEQIRQRLESCARAPGLSYRGLRHDLPVPAQDVVLRGLNATTRRPLLALAQPRARRGDLAMVGQRLLAVQGVSGRDAREVSVHPDDDPVVLLPGTTLRPLGRRSIGGTQVSLWVEVAAGGLAADAAALWSQVAAALIDATPPGALAREPNPYFGGDLG